MTHVCFILRGAPGGRRLTAPLFAEIVDKILLILVVHGTKNTDVLEITFEHVRSSKIYLLTVFPYILCIYGIYSRGLRHTGDREEK